MTETTQDRAASERTLFAQVMAATDMQDVSLAMLAEITRLQDRLGRVEAILASRFPESGPRQPK